MAFIFNILSGEKENFFLQIEIDSNKSFLELHNIIQSELNFDSSQMATIFLTNEHWEKEIEISQVDMGLEDDVYSEIILMEDTVIGEMLMQKKDKLIYVFDLFNDRALFVELFDINKKKIKKAKSLQSKGTIPEQVIFSEDILEENLNVDSFEDDFDDEFNDGMDFESLEGLDEYQ